MKNKLKVFALSRFHIFQLAKVLKENNRLELLVTAYPKFKIRKEWPLFLDILKSYPIFAAIRFLVLIFKRFRLESLASKLQEFMHTQFSETTARLVNDKDSFVIGLSSFMEETILASKLKGVITIVEHGSLDIRTERDLLQKECDIHGFKPFGNWQHTWLIEKMKREFDEADYIFCCSKLAKQTLVDHGVDEGKVYSNPLGVNLDRFRIKPNRQGAFKYLHVSNMSPLKGLHHIIEAFSRLNARECELWLVGPMPNDPKLQMMIKSDLKIKYLGYLAESELPAIYNQCDVFVHPSLSDGWAMTVLQSMASGVPAIVSDMTGAKEIIDEGHNGWVVKAADTEELYQTMLSTYVNRRELVGIGKQASLAVSSGYSWDDYGTRLLKILDEIEVQSNNKR